MARELKCDICKRVTEDIVGKLFYTPLGRGKNANGFHVNYSHHLDVGVCCSDRLLDGFDFRPRKTAKQYNESRRKAAVKK